MCSVVFSGAAFASDSRDGGADEQAGGAHGMAYTPDKSAGKYITELVQSGMLPYSIYDKYFETYLTRADLAAYAMSFYYFLGGADPGDPGDNYSDTDDLNAEKAYALGFFVADAEDETGYDDGANYGGGAGDGTGTGGNGVGDGSDTGGEGTGEGSETGDGDGTGGDTEPIDKRKHFYPEDSVKKGEAIAVMARAIIKVRPSDAASVPTADAAHAALSAIYRDVYYAKADELPYIYFMSARGALLLTRNEQSGNASLGADYEITRSSFFLLYSDIAWAFVKNVISRYAVPPADPTASEYQNANVSCYKNNVYLYWKEAADAYMYEVGVYVAKKKKADITVDYSALSLNRNSKPTYHSVFGNPKSKKSCYLSVRAVDRHGVKSKKKLKVNFFAEKYVNVNHKFFGNKNRFGFKNAKAAKKYQKTVKVNVWKVSGGKKVKSAMYVTVNKELADDVRKIFAEIFKGKEKFPIKAMGGFQIRASKTSEHNYGTAIDINPTENCMKDGNKVTAGKFWRPGKNKYSIKPNGDVVKAFEKYGWYWGGNGWGNRKDYMHFSYFHG
jgi:hypothetical protein